MAMDMFVANTCNMQPKMDAPTMTRAPHMHMTRKAPCNPRQPRGKMAPTVAVTGTKAASHLARKRDASTHPPRPNPLQQAIKNATSCPMQNMPLATYRQQTNKFRMISLECVARTQVHVISKSRSAQD